MSPRGLLKLIFFLAVVVAFGGCAKAEFELADGTSLGLSDLRGKWLIVNYWAEWCAPCRMEIPELNQLSEERSPDVVVLGVNFDGLSGPPLLKLKEKMGIRFSVLISDPGPRWQADRPTVLPTTLLITPDGKLQDVLVGPQTRQSLEQAMHLTTSM